jgi:hypothetical protein
MDERQTVEAFGSGEYDPSMLPPVAPSIYDPTVMLVHPDAVVDPLNGETLLHVACKAGQVRAVKELLRRGANTLVVNVRGRSLVVVGGCHSVCLQASNRTVMDEAEAHGQEQVTRYLEGKGLFRSTRATTHNTPRVPASTMRSPTTGLGIALSPNTVKRPIKSAIKYVDSAAARAAMSPAL